MSNILRGRTPTQPTLFCRGELGDILIETNLSSLFLLSQLCLDFIVFFLQFFHLLAFFSLRNERLDFEHDLHPLPVFEVLEVGFEIN